MLHEDFTYDSFNRLTSVETNGVTYSMVYDSYGRMSSKQQRGFLFTNARYSSTHPHAIARVQTNPVPPINDHTITYTPFDKVETVRAGRDEILFEYGYDRQRIRMTETFGGHERVKTYIGNCEFVDNDFGPRYSFTHLCSPDGIFAVAECTREGCKMHYVHTDNLGSWDVITDNSGQLEQSLSFDAWGNRRNADTWTGPALDEPLFDRGFTGHEHLYYFGLINMNGRMYDPVLSSFLSPDNYMQDPTTQQGFNRYAYCMYNPLKYVDPSGERCQGIEMTYLIEQMMKEFVINEWRSHYDTSMASHFVTLAMASCLFSHGEENSGSSVNHGSPLGNGGGSVEARSLGNGKYEVVNGLYDGGNTVYIVDDQGNRTGILGYTLTSWTFYKENGNLMDNIIIDINDTYGQEYLDDFINNTPEFFDYFFSDNTGLRGGYYDFKARNPNKGSNYGMMVDFEFGCYITTSRDLGNYTAGYLGGVYGLPYNMVRFGMDFYQFLTNGRFEPPVSRIPQNIGYYYGNYHYYSLMLMNLLNYFKP